MEPIVSLLDIIQERNVDAPGSYSFKQTLRTSQKRPYNIPTEYYRSSCVCERGTKGSAMSNYLGWANASSAKADPAFYPGCEDSYPERDMVINMARNKFVQGLSDRVLTAVNYAERKQSFGMLSRRAKQVGRIADFIRGGEFSRVHYEIALRNRYSSSWVKRSEKWVKKWTQRRRSNPGRYRRSGAAADAFLEYAFGWSPLLKDIVVATEVLSNTPSGVIKGASARLVAQRLSLQTGGTTRIETTLTFQAQMGAQVSVDNPNLWLANQLGLLDVAGTAWELIRFSFLIDYIFNVNQFLSQWTDFSGLKLQYPWSTVTTRDGACKVKYYYSPGNELECVTTYSSHRRYLGIPGVVLSVQPYNPLNPFRAGVSISLLLQKLRNLNPK